MLTSKPELEAIAMWITYQLFTTVFLFKLHGNTLLECANGQFKHGCGHFLKRKMHYMVSNLVLL